MASTVRFVREDRLYERVVLENECLRDLQQELCVAFDESFPKNMAEREIGEEHFDSFYDLPFSGKVRLTPCSM